MTCEELDELAGAIALDAIPDDEWPAVREHLATCPHAHDEVRRLLAIAPLLLEAVPPVEPPPGLRERILAAARAESEGEDDGGELHAGLAGPPVSLVTPIRLASNRRWWRNPAWDALAAGLAIAAVMAAWNVSLRRNLDRTETRLAVQERALAVVAGDGRAVAFTAVMPGTGGTVLRPADGPATIVVHGLPRAENGTYQIWALRGDQPESLGTFTPDGAGRRVVSLHSDLSNVDAVAITHEPSPDGSRLPTSQPILLAPVRDQAQRLTQAGR